MTPVRVGGPATAEAIRLGHWLLAAAAEGSGATVRAVRNMYGAISRRSQAAGQPGRAEVAEVADRSGPDGPLALWSKQT